LIGLIDDNPLRALSPPTNGWQPSPTPGDNMSQKQVVSEDDQEEMEKVRPSKKGKKRQRCLHKRHVSPVDNAVDNDTMEPPPSKRPKHRSKPPLPAPLQTRSAAM
jgi:hypothetical protein